MVDICRIIKILWSHFLYMNVYVNVYVCVCEPSRCNYRCYPCHYYFPSTLLPYTPPPHLTHSERQSKNRWHFSLSFAIFHPRCDTSTNAHTYIHWECEWVVQRNSIHTAKYARICELGFTMGGGECVSHINATQSDTPRLMVLVNNWRRRRQPTKCKCVQVSRIPQQSIEKCLRGVEKVECGGAGGGVDLYMLRAGVLCRTYKHFPGRARTWRGCWDSVI